MAFLSIIIAAHNAEDTLHATLESLQNAIGSAGDAVEIIIFNDSSDDGTQDIIEAWLPKLPHATTRCVDYRNVGRVRNSAVTLASGDYITMLDSDDRLKPGSIQDAVDFLQAQRPDMLLTRLREIRDIQKITSTWQGFDPMAISQQDAISRFLRHKDFQAHLIGQFIHKDLYKANPIPSMVCYEDFAVFPGMIMQAHKIFYQRQGHYYYIKRHGSLSSDLDVSKITSLVDCTLRMEETFPRSFKHLINCHWFDIYSNHKKYLSTPHLNLVKDRVSQLYSISFFMDTHIRFSYKKRVIEALWKK